MQKRSRGLRELCGLLGYSAQAYYQYRQGTQERTFRQEKLILQLLEYRRLQPRLGARKLLAMLQADGISIGRDAFFDLLREHGLLVRKRRNRMRTTFSCHRFRKYADLTVRLTIERPEQLWVSDITYIRLKRGFAYLSLVTEPTAERS